MSFEEFKRIGRRLYAEGLVSGNFGNMSVRNAGGFFITPRGAFLDTPGDPVFVPSDGPVPETASIEYRVHRGVYSSTPYAAVIHAHPPCAVALSFDRDVILPGDCEGMMVAPRITIVEGTAGTPGLARVVADALRAGDVVIARGHGTFSAGMTLEEAYIKTTVVEHACRVLLYRSCLKNR